MLLEDEPLGKCDKRILAEIQSSLCFMHYFVTQYTQRDIRA